MRQTLDDYAILDYRNWIIGDEAREGINIKRLDILSSTELELFNQSIPFQDSRNDPGQAELVTYFALELLEYFSGKREVVVPAAIFHDTGYHYENPDDWHNLMRSGDSHDTEIVRRPHQNRGIMIASRIMERTNYPKEYYVEIADIIGDHDTRLLPVTSSGVVVRNADMLWRVTYPNLKIYVPDSTPELTFNRLSKATLDLPPPRNLEPIVTEIARLELANTMFYEFGEKCSSFLKTQGYSKELGRVVDSYH